MPETKLVVLILSAIAFAAGCAHARPTLEIGADACERLAVVHERPDIAAICRKGGDVAPLLDLLLRESRDASADECDAR